MLTNDQARVKLELERADPDFFGDFDITDWDALFELAEDRENFERFAVMFAEGQIQIAADCKVIKHWQNRHEKAEKVIDKSMTRIHDLETEAVNSDNSITTQTATVGRLRGMLEKIIKLSEEWHSHDGSGYVEIARQALDGKE